jgi:hypothetical protein
MRHGSVPMNSSARDYKAWYNCRQLALCRSPNHRIPPFTRLFGTATYQSQYLQGRVSSMSSFVAIQTTVTSAAVLASVPRVEWK